MDIFVDHDQRFKELLREFFADFLHLFFGEWAKRFDLTRIDWLDQELQPEPPIGPRFRIDLLARLTATEPIDLEGGGSTDHWLALIHVEIESPDRTTRIKPRLPEYYIHLRSRHKIPVLPIVVYLNVAMDGIGVDEIVEKFWEFPIHTMKYLYVGLPGLDAERYVPGNNWLGVALSALMKIPAGRAAELGAEALRRLVDAPLTDHQRFLLAECVQAYLPLDDSQQTVFERIIQGSDFQGVRAMNKTVFEKGLERGMEKGLERGKRLGARTGYLGMLAKILEKRFGVVSPQLMERLELLTEDQLMTMAQTALDAKSIDELKLN